MSDTVQTFTPKQRQERAARSPGERQTIMKSMFVGHTNFTLATEAIARFHMPVKGGVHDTGCLFVLAGVPRAGKSYVLQRYARDFPNVTGEKGVERPVVYVDLPVDCSKRGFVEALAGALNTGHAAKTNVDDIFGNVLNDLRHQKVQLLLLDETQEAFSTKRPAAATAAKGYIRKILNLRTLNVVAAGLPETYSLMAADEQLKGRGNLPYHVVYPYDWENKEHRGLFRLLCDSIDERLPFAEKSKLGSVQTAWRLHWVSDGVVGRLTDFIFPAACDALNEGSPNVTWGHFADHYDRIKPPGQTFNPFRDEMGSSPGKAA
ncbi:TniB family NTP-binding protein [Salinarimonas soli]|uniref:AAA family ATPase n=1 Tax=Salinarimonas soli TaxID=1638099 RepID=A0A5B2V5V9_9HYPH|nr:TniB family NTP-binding protein [Salinarimonas soli]KAA2234913.1 AAA family ATPase [Salinarimonas soli]